MTRSQPVILVVEDQALVRETLIAGLKQSGYRVESAADFPEGAAMLRSIAPALLIANVNLPNGDGRNLKKLARAMDIPVVLISAHPHTDPDPRVKFLQKPFQLKDLEREVERLLAPP